MVQVDQPPIDTVVALKKSQEIKFESNLKDTLGKIWLLTLEAYPQATETESERHTSLVLLNILPSEPALDTVHERAED